MQAPARGMVVALGNTFAVAVCLALITPRAYTLGDYCSVVAMVSLVAALPAVLVGAVMGAIAAEMTKRRHPRAIVFALRVGDTVQLQVNGRSGPRKVTVAVTGYEVPVVRLEERADATERQRVVRARWLAGTP